MRGLFTCVTDLVNGPPGSDTEGLGWEQVWSKRISTLGGNLALFSSSPQFDAGDNETFRGGNSVTGANRATTDANRPTAPCPTGIPAFDSTTNIELTNGAVPNDAHRNRVELFHDLGDQPLLVDVAAFDWVMDLREMPTASNGGARWLGEVNVEVRDGRLGPLRAATGWQRAAENATIVGQVEGYRSDPRGIEASGDRLFNAIKGSLQGIIDCLCDTVAAEVSVDSVIPATNARSCGAYAFPLPDFNDPHRGWTDFNQFTDDPNNGVAHGAGRSHGGHDGIDLFAPRGSDVHAFVGGTITQRTFNQGPCEGNANGGGFGRVIKIAGDDGKFYAYAHLDGFGTFNTGDRVEAGDIIGFVGDSGNACGAGPHLHFEQRTCNNFSSSTECDINPYDDLTAVWNCPADAGDGTTDPNPGDDQSEPETQDGAICRCLESAQGLLDGLDAIRDAFLFAASTANNPVPGNPPWLSRSVETLGHWELPVVLLPGQSLVVETRSRYANWDLQQAGGIPQTHTFCSAEGATRPGQISMVVNPMVGGRQCDPDQAHGGPLVQVAAGTENGGSNLGRAEGTLGN